MLTWRHEISTPTILQKENSQRVVSFKTNFVRIISAEIIQYYRSTIFFLQVERYKKDRYKKRRGNSFHFLYLIRVNLIRTFIGRKRSIQKYVFEGKAEKVYFVTTSILNHWWIFSSIWQEKFPKIIHTVFMYSCKLFVD